MKRFFVLLVPLLALLAMLAGCPGMEGKAYVTFTYSATDGPQSRIDGALTSFSGLPANAVPNTPYLVAAGSYTGNYVLYWTELVTAAHLDPPSPDPGATSYTNHYHAHFNTDWYTWGPTAADAATKYQTDLFATAYNTANYTVTVKRGPNPSTPGADSNFVITLAWDPTQSGVASSRDVAAREVVVEDSPARVVKEVTDGDATLQLTITKRPR